MPCRAPRNPGGPRTWRLPRWRVPESSLSWLTPFGFGLGPLPSALRREGRTGSDAMQGGKRNRPGRSSPDAGFRKIFPSFVRASSGKNFRKAPRPLRARSGSVRYSSVRRRARGVRPEGVCPSEEMGRPPADGGVWRTCVAGCGTGAYNLEREYWAIRRRGRRLP